jgi:hypothetical protein
MSCDVIFSLSNLVELVLDETHHLPNLPVHPMIHVRTAELSLSKREGSSVPISKVCRAFPGLDSLVLVRSDVRVQSDDVNFEAKDLWSHLTSLKLKGCDSTWSMLNAGLLRLLTSLRVLLLESCDLYFPPRSGADFFPGCSALTQLQVLQLKDTDVRSLPDSFSSLVTLTRLDLQGNKQLTHLPNSISKLTASTCLDAHV